MKKLAYGINAGDTVTAELEDRGIVGTALSYANDHFTVKVGNREFEVYKTKVENSR